jgi:alpha-tubulin suppressor-like RCC1 family protein
MLHNRGSNCVTACSLGCELWMTGCNTNGQLGQLNVAAGSSPVQVTGTTWTYDAVGTCFTLASCANGTLWAWGNNANGQLGLNDRAHRSSPTQIPGTTWRDVKTGISFSATKRSDGTLWAWGLNTNGQLGQSDRVHRSSPVQIPGTTWSTICLSGANSIATRTDGTLWSWGTGTNGQLGLSDTAHRSSPTQIPGTTWCGIATGSQSYGLRTDGTLWAWGLNANGQLGQSTVSSRSSPIQIPGTTWCSVVGGLTYALALRTDGTLWAWGNNANGQLGLNDTAHRSSPTQIPGTTWCTIFSISQTDISFAKRTDGTLWAWGLNTGAQLGDGTIVSKSSPVQIPGTTWLSVNSSPFNTVFLKANSYVAGTFSTANLANIRANDTANIIFSPGTVYVLNDEIVAKDFGFKMNPKSKILEANVITQVQSSTAGGNVYGGTANGWYTVQFFDNTGSIGADIGNKTTHGVVTPYTNTWARLTTLNLTPTQVQSNTFGIKLGSLASATPNPTVCVDSVHISLWVENAGNNSTQDTCTYQWTNPTDLI